MDDLRGLFDDLDLPNEPPTLSAETAAAMFAYAEEVGKSIGTEEEPAPDIEGQAVLFETGDAWEEHWGGMPDFDQNDLTPAVSLVVHFASYEDRKEFSKLLGQTLTGKTQSVWYPKAEIGTFIDKRYVDEP